ncbi:mediator complex subunit Med5-domain-containing protein [Amylostereum chailletii]|nr:mediator complex subunit Med5-domain-containing protein [Amylostereum chailletii]
MSFPEGPDAVLATIRDALVLLRTAYTLSFPSRQHQHLESAGDLVVLLANSFTTVSKASSALALACMDEAKNLLSNPILQQNVRMALEGFVMSLSFLTDDEVAFLTDHQMMNSIQSSLTKGDVLGPGSDQDMISCCLLLYHLVHDRAREYGSGTESHAVAMMMATFRASAWPLVTFYTQILLSAISWLTQDLAAFSPTLRGSKPSLWKAFVVGRLPRLLATFHKLIEEDDSVKPEHRATAMRDAWGRISVNVPRHSILTQYEQSLGMLQPDDQMMDGSERLPSFTRDFTQQLVFVGLIDATFMATVEPSAANSVGSQIQLKAREHNVELESHIAYKLSPENSSAEDIVAFLNKLYGDYSCHGAFAVLVRKCFTASVTNFDIETLSQFARLLYSNEFAADIVSLHVPMRELLSHALAIFEDYDCETVGSPQMKPTGDPQTAVSHLGDVVIFIQWAATKYNLFNCTHKLGARSLDPSPLWNTHFVHRVEDLTAEYADAFGVWFKALFDKTSEGIEDGILRATRPKTLLALAATLSSNAITACAERRFDMDVLNNGIAYFLSPLLNWTLLGIVQALLRDIRNSRFRLPHYLHVLLVLLSSETFPPALLSLCARPVLRLLCDPNMQRFIPKSYDTSKMRARMLVSLHLPPDVNSEPLIPNAQPAWADQPLDAIQTALTTIQARKPPSLDVGRCLLVVSPTRFLHLFWNAISIAPISMGLQVDGIRRLAVYVLATPRTPRTPPLLPIFLHNVFPTILDVVDHQSSSSQSMGAELLVSVIASSIMAALHLERAITAINGEQGSPVGESSSSMARHLAGDLRHRKNSPVAKLIAQRLASSRTFVASFPVFKTEI